MSSSQNSSANRLINESSPYLLQHAYNPVDWYPWGKEALDKAAEEDKMILVSIGYAACHWCHVMEHESFEDSLVASIMNENFICIKVDREERPDVDDVYMTACSLSGSPSCGWPLNAFALPDGRPVWAGTYFPKENWIKILEQFIELKKKDMARLERSAEGITKGISNYGAIVPVTEVSDFDQKDLTQIAEIFLGTIDLMEGGRRGAPKFPMPNNYEFLLKYYYQTGDTRYLDAVTLTLDKIAAGGIYDQVGGGFARYSVDAYWKVPHFEKMLYDNGQLLGLYSDAFRLTKKDRYLQVVNETVNYLIEDHLDKSGGFYSSYDADSEGEEGTYYVWTADELRGLWEADYELLADFYNITEEGNWEHSNILHHTTSTAEFASLHSIPLGQFEKQLENAKEILKKARNDRIKPGLDDKVLASWNGLLLSGLAKAYCATQNPKALELASNLARFLEKEMIQDDGRINRNFKDGSSTINGFLDDYANVAQGYIELYSTTLHIHYLEMAKKLIDYTEDHFLNSVSGMYEYTSNLDDPLVAKPQNFSDNVIPAGNSVMARNLFTLGSLYDKKEYKDKAVWMLSNMESMIRETSQPSFYSNWLQLYLWQVYPPYEVAITGGDATNLVLEMKMNYLPNVIYLGGAEENLPLLENKVVEDESYIYVCQNKVCKFPVQEVDKALNLIGGNE